MSVPIARNVAGQSVGIVLFDSAGAVVTTPTIVAGDVQISLNFGAFGNLATLPAETPAGGGQVEVALSQAETNAVHVGIRWIDQAGAQWVDGYYSIFTETSTIGAIATALAAGVAAILAAITAIETSILAAIAAAVVTLSALINAVCSCVISWFVANLSAVQQAGRGDELQLYRGDTWVQPFSLSANISARTNVWFTVKEDKDHTDLQADIQIDENSGLIRIEGGPPDDPLNGSITITDPVTGTGTIRLEAVESAKLDDVGKFIYDFQVLFADGTVTSFGRDGYVIIGDVTRAVA